MSPHDQIPPIVSASWLAAHLDEPSLVVLDVSLNVQGSGALQIPTTQVFDIDRDVIDKSSQLPHMLPGPEEFTLKARAVGVNPNSLVVVYDRTGIYSSPRGRWMFQVMGHSHVAVLDGGMPAWVAAGLPTESRSIGSSKRGTFTSAFNAQLYANAAMVDVASRDKTYAIIDARSQTRFRAEESEPRPGVRSGHIPNSINIPFTEVVDRGHMRAPAELGNIFSPLVREDQKLIFYCGSGVTACILALAAEICGYPSLAVYDGSWCEWASLY